MNKTIINVLISVFSLVFIFSIFEIGTRIYSSEYRFTNFLGKERTLYSIAPADFHSELGWIPKTGSFGNSDAFISHIGNNKVTVLEDGIRANGRKALNNSNELVLAVGDSFTFGDGVSDSETWPAILEELSGIRVINGGVFGYGIDQSFLRMKMLSGKYKPTMIIFSFIADDIVRCELSERTSVPKPYFKVSDGKLILKENHVASYTPVSHVPDFFRKGFGYSFFVHTFMMKTFKHYWLLGLSGNKKTQIHSQGEDVACLIFKELNNYASKHGIKVFVLVQYGKNLSYELARVDNVIKCVDKPLQLVDLHNRLLELKKKDKEKYERLFDVHMTKEGNYYVATILNELINQQEVKIVF